MEVRQHTLDIHPWKISTTTLDKNHRRLHESITSLGNGYMGMRGNLKNIIVAIIT